MSTSSTDPADRTRPAGASSAAPGDAACATNFPPTAAVEAARGAAVGPATPPPGTTTTDRTTVVGSTSAKTVGGAPGATPEAFAAGAAEPSGNGHSTNGKSNPAARAFGELSDEFGQLKDYASYYMAAKADGFKQTFKNVALYAVLGIVGAIVGGAILVTAAVLLVTGISDALTALFGGREWAGKLVTAVLLLGGLGVGMWLMIKKVTNNWKSALEKKYADWRAEQKSRFGTDVQERARERKSPQSQQN
ncbi:MAG TPA: hypothetical protein VEA69_11930 [Tepidisphaeraceae bacterium]|nr:hypothetical protein [Tepidisphaeraceae bacterium]